MNAVLCNDEILTEAELASRLKFKPSTITRWRQEGVISPCAPGRYHWPSVLHALSTRKPRRRRMTQTQLSNLRQNRN